MIRTAIVATSNASRRLLRAWDWRAAAPAVLYVAMYVLLDRLSYVRPNLKLEITPWNPQAGLTLAFLLFYGPRSFPVTAAAALLSDLLVRATPVPLSLTLAASLWIALVYGTLAAALRRWRLAGPIETTMGAAQLTALLVTGTLMGAAGYISLFVWAGELLPSDAIRGTTRYWVANLNGVLNLAPLLIYATDWRERLWAVRLHRREILVQFAAVVLTLWGIFALPASDQLRFFYLLFVPVIWIALRWSWAGSMLAVLAIQVGLLIAADTKIPTPRYIDLQFLMLTLSSTALMLGAVVKERAGVLRRVAEREAEQRALLAMAPDGVLAVNGSGSIRMANAAAMRLFGSRAATQPAPSLTVFLPGLQLESPEGRATLGGRREDGSAFPAEIAWARLDPPADQGYLVTVRDVTDRRRAEEQLRARDAALARAMRFAVAGELASALAHELNQPITALVSYLRAAEILATRTSGDDGRLEPTLSKAAQEAIRASEVLRRLRDFYRGGTLKRETVHIPSLCGAVVGAFQDRLRRADATLTVSVDPSIQEVEGDGTQLEIVLHNLLANAVDAVSQVPQQSRRIELHGECAEGIVILRVDDTGPGIVPDVAKKLFEPFITSKPDGMGLGLAISRSLIRARGGELLAAPSPKLGGASFTIRLPIEIPSDTPLI